MRLVENEGISAGQDFAETFLAYRKVGKQQVMIDDDQVSFLRGLSCLHDMAISELGTFRTQAILGRRGDLRPQRRVFRNFGQFRLVATQRALGPGANGLNLGNLFARGEATVAMGQLHTMQTKVIRTTLE